MCVYLFCSPTLSSSAVPCLDWWIISALCSAVARLVQPDCTTQLQLPHLHSTHTHTHTHRHTHTLLHSWTPSLLTASPSQHHPACQLLPCVKGCNKLLSPPFLFFILKQQQFSISRCLHQSGRGCSLWIQQMGLEVSSKQKRFNPELLQYEACF